MNRLLAWTMRHQGLTLLAVLAACLAVGGALALGISDDRFDGLELDHQQVRVRDHYIDCIVSPDGDVPDCDWEHPR